MVTKVGNEFNLEIFGWEIAWGKKKRFVFCLKKYSKFGQKKHISQ